MIRQCLVLIAAIIIIGKVDHGKRVEALPIFGEVDACGIRATVLGFIVELPYLGLTQKINTKEILMISLYAPPLCKAGDQPRPEQREQTKSENTHK